MGRSCGAGNRSASQKARDTCVNALAEAGSNRSSTFSRRTPHSRRPHPVTATHQLLGRASSPPYATPAEETQSECSCHEADELRHAPSRLRSSAPPRSRRIQMAPTTLPNAARQTPPRKAKLQGWRPSFHRRPPAIRTERSPANPACSI